MASPAIYKFYDEPLSLFARLLSVSHGYRAVSRQQALSRIDGLPPPQAAPTIHVSEEFQAFTRGRFIIIAPLYNIEGVSNVARNWRENIAIIDATATSLWKSSQY